MILFHCLHRQAKTHAHNLILHYTLAKTDADADAIVKRYKIVYTSPAKAKTLSTLAP